MTLTPFGSGVSQRAENVRFPRQQGLIGDPATGDTELRETNVLNQAPAAKQVDTVTVTGATNDKTYTITLEGIDVSFLADGTATTPEIAAGLAAAVEAEPQVRGFVTAVAAASVVTLTGVIASQAYTVAESDAQLDLVSVQAAADAAAVPFGRAMAQTDFLNRTQGLPAGRQATRVGQIADTLAFAAQVDSWTLVYDALVTVSMSVTIDGQTYTGSIVMAGASDIDTQGPLLAAELATALPANSATPVYAGSGVITLTADTDGSTFDSAVSFAPPVGATVDTGTAVLSSNKSIVTSLEQAFVGVSRRTRDQEIPAGATEAVYPPGTGVTVVFVGQMRVANDEAIAFGDRVYVEMAAGDMSGTFWKTASATRVLLPLSLARWQRPHRPDSSGVAILSTAVTL